MNKNAYVAPEMEVMNVETIEMMASSPEIDLNGESKDSSDQLLPGRRGTWGNFWN